MPLQLLLDMKVQWGSTYVMLHRADSRKEVHIFCFISNIAQLLTILLVP